MPTPGLSVVSGIGTVDGAWYCCQISLWSRIRKPHVVRIGTVLPLEMGGLRPGENHRMGSAGGLPGLTLLRAVGAAHALLFS